MKETFKNNLKVTLISVAVIVMVVAGFLLNIFLGNPLSKSGANKQIKIYLNDTYGIDKYKISTPIYDFKTMAYHTVITSPTSEDTQFEVSYGDGQITDTHSVDVEGRNNTWMRLHMEFGNIATAVFEEHYKADIFIAGLGRHHTEADVKRLALDMPLDLEKLPLDSFAVIYMKSEDRTWENLAKIAKDIDERFAAQKIKIDSYDIALEPPNEAPGQAVGVYDFQGELLKKDNLPQVMKEHYEAWLVKQKKV